MNYKKDEILEKIRDVLVEEFEMDREKLKPGALLVDDLDLDSIDAVDLIVRIQRQVNIRVTTDDFKSIRTLEDVAEVIARLANEQK